MNTDPKNPGNSFRPTKKLGQNFLTDKTVINRILEYAALGPQDVVIEVGPGKGALTGRMAAVVSRVFAIEKDGFLFGELTNKYASLKNLTLINEDALLTDFKNLHGKNKVKFIANLPYNITSPMLSRLTEHREIFSGIIIMIQKEVGDRIASGPGNKTYGALSVLIQTFFNVTRLFTVPPGSFRPKPKVDSVVIKLVPSGQYCDLIKNTDLYYRVVKSSFSSRRKMISNSLRSEFNKEDIEVCLGNAAINGNRRAETLTVSEYIELSNKFYELQQSTSSDNKSF